MNTLPMMGILSGILALAGLFFLMFAVSSFFFPQSRTTVEVYPTDVKPPRQGKTIGLQLAIGLIALGLACLLFYVFFIPEISAISRNVQLGEAEEVTHTLFVTKFQKKPKSMSFSEDTRNVFGRVLRSDWDLTGVAEFDDDVPWDLVVSKRGIEVRCEAKRRN